MYDIFNAFKISNIYIHICKYMHEKYVDPGEFLGLLIFWPAFELQQCSGALALIVSNLLPL